MLIQYFFHFLYGMIEDFLSILPQFPTLELFESLDTSEFTDVFTNVTNILGYFLPCGTIVTIIGVQLLITHYKTISAVLQSIKSEIPFV